MTRSRLAEESQSVTSRDIYRQTLLRFLIAVLAMLALVLTGPAFEFSPATQWFIFFYQDAAFLLLMPLLFLAMPRAGAAAPQWLVRLSNPAFAIGLAVALVGICWAGHHFVFLDHNLSRDEQMADFDAWIFAHGRLFWPIPPAWRPFADALNQLYIQPIGAHEAWVSAYLPVNAALRAAVGTIATPALTSPLLAGIGLLALWRIALRLWPDSPSTRAVVLILYAGSAQVIVTGMTAFAMTGHLALDLVWLMVFLQDRRASHAGAILVGFLATGLHQPLFHPLFVLPFIVMLIAQRRWRLVAFYTAGYALIGTFWFAWPIWISSHGMGPVIVGKSKGIDYLTRLIDVIVMPDIKSVWVTAVNLLRFVTWQHLLMLPLAVFGARAAWRSDPLVRAMAISFCLPIFVMFVLMPDQGHGWGYRYLHGVIGNACLLAGYGWYALEARGLSLQRALVWTSAISLLLILPVRAYMAYEMAAPYVRVNDAIVHTKASMVIVDGKTVVFARDLILNRPDLSNRPLRLLVSKLKPADMASLCKRGSIAFFFTAQLQPFRDYFGLPLVNDPPKDVALERAARADDCTIVPAGSAR